MMGILRVKDKRVVSRVVDVLERGGVCVVPTDTVYGLIANATDEKAVQKIFSIKGRLKDKAVSIFVDDIHMARQYAEILEKVEDFLERVWPGPVMGVFKAAHQNGLSSVLAGRKGTVGMRAPDHEFLQKILSSVDFPLAQSSANISGKLPAKHVDEVVLYFQNKEIQPDLVVDGGALGRRPSTVVDFSRNKRTVLREGAVSKKKILGLLQELGLL